MKAPSNRDSMRWFTAVLCLLCLAALSQLAAANEHCANRLYQSLLSDGVTLSDGTAIKLPHPSLSDQASGTDQQQALTKAAGKLPLEEFVRDSWTARFRIDLESLENQSGHRTGQTVDVWFVAYGTLQAIEEHELLEELGQLNREKSSQQERNLDRPLSQDELARHQITADTDEEKLVELYGYFDAPLLNKVQISGVTRSMLTRGEKSTLAAIVLDERFADDPEIPNQWRSLIRNEAGELELGPAQAYSGFGGYAKATQLVAPPGALLVEMHVAFDEPQGWFGGANLLRAKLPLVVQQNVRAFRKKLKDLATTSEQE